jgi:hypothetical protein
MLEIEIVTPSGVSGRVQTLDKSWELLVYDNNGKKSNLVQIEYPLWQAWMKSISYMDKVFASGTLSELDRWQARYDAALKDAQKFGVVNAPEASPKLSFWQSIPWYAWSVVGVLAVTAMYFLPRPRWTARSHAVAGYNQRRSGGRRRLSRGR